MTKSNPMWGGRFLSATNATLQKINQSISFDVRLYKHDILASKAHCKMLAKTKIIAKAECKKIINGLNKIDKEISDGKFKFKSELEDIHMNIESALEKTIGVAAGKLHTARSRNDQVVTDFKLWIREALDCLDMDLKKLQLALVNKAEKHSSTIMPGFTHLQLAQPVTLGHHMMAYFEMFKRDRSRIKDARVRLNECPLGSAALAGTSFPIDRSFTAKELKFYAPTANSLDSVSDRDFVMEYLSVASMCAIHLSRLAEEIIIWSTDQFGFIKLSDAFTTGSSIMPQKRNPDAAELIRAKSARIIGNLNSVLIMMKGLPLAYAKDMQEDKEPVFDTHDTIILSVSTMAAMINNMQINKQKMYRAATSGFSTATDLADWLVKNLKLSFRQAHKISGKIVMSAEGKNCELKDLDLVSMQTIEPKITNKIYKILDIESSVKNKTSFGGTSPENVKAAVKSAVLLLE
ncbi:Argininosuccinate lyase [Gammaproteobacteria bacterium]